MIECPYGCNMDHGRESKGRLCGYYWPVGRGGSVCTRPATHCGVHVDRVNERRAPRDPKKA